MIITKRAYARAGFVGNPSDGYHGKTLAFTIGDYCAEVVLYESPELSFSPSSQDHAVFDSLDHLLDDVRRTGYYGGIRLLKAATKSFAEYCAESSIQLPRRNFTVRYGTSIPRQVGLGGSSAIVTAVMRALMEFFEIRIPEQVLPNVVLGAARPRPLRAPRSCAAAARLRGVSDGPGRGELDRPPQGQGALRPGRPEGGRHHG